MSGRSKDSFAWAGIAAAALLLAGVVVLAVRVASHYRGLRAEVGRVAVTRLEEPIRATLAGLADRVFVTYYVTARADMPSHLRRLERDVTDFLQVLEDHAGSERFDFQIVDPEEDADLDLKAFGAKRHVSPIRVRHVERDAYSEEVVYSSLTIEYGPNKPAVVNGVTPEHVPRLQALFVEQLRHMEAPRRGTIALAPVRGFEKIEEALRGEDWGGAEVVRVDLDGGAPFPTEADALIWLDPALDPARIPARVRELEAFLERGRSAVIAGSEWNVDPSSWRTSSPELQLERTPFPAEELWGELGLKPVRELVCDGFGGRLGVGSEDRELPFYIRCIAPNQDFQGLVNQPNGNLMFMTPTALGLDDERLAERAWSAKVLATTSEHTFVLPLPDDAVPLDEVDLYHGERAPKQPLMVLLRPDDPWRGELYCLAASTPFLDELYDIGGVAHWRLLRTLKDNLLSDERLVLARVSELRPEPLPPLSPTARLGWRAACVVLLPLALLLLALWRGAFRTGSGVRERLTSAAGLRTGVLSAGAVIFALLLVGIGDAIPARADLTADDLNSLSGYSRELAAQAVGADAVEIDFVLSSPRRLPPAVRLAARGVRRTLDAFESAGAETSVREIDPDALDEDERAELEQAGLGPFRVTTRVEEVTTVSSIWSGLRLRSRGREEVLPLPDAQSFEDLEFKLAFALWRLQTGKRPKVIVAPDFPRPTSAEAYEEFQMKGLFSPMGADVYSLARRLLADAGFEVLFVNTRSPEWQWPYDEIDAFLWLQPRRPVQATMDLWTEYLHSGGNVLVAAQHFNVQARQYRGNDAFQMLYWPAPQTPDVETYYYPDLGLRMVRWVLCDELHTRTMDNVLIKGRGPQREFERMEIAKPFLVRAAAANFSSGARVMRGVGDQGWIWGNRIEIDAERLAQLGLSHEVLMWSSPRTWEYHWERGFIPDEEMEARPDADGDGAPDYLGRLPLAVEVEGQFPLPAEPLYEFPPPPQAFEPIGPDELVQKEPPPSPEHVARDARRAAVEPAPGRLMLFACSEAFKDHRLRHPDFRADHLLLNAVAELALPPELADISTRRPVRRGFDYVEPEARLFWRAIVLGAWPAVLLLLYAIRRLRGGIAA